MLRQQMLQQQARELALHYLARSGEPLSPQDYLDVLRQTERLFLRLLQGERVADASAQ